MLGEIGEVVGALLAWDNVLAVYLMSCFLFRLVEDKS